MNIKLKHLLVSFLVLSVILGFLHFNTPLQRNLIDYDDLDVVAKMLKLDWYQYFFSWLPDRRNYAFPLRDATLFLDELLSTERLPTFWISNFFYFLVSLFTIGQTLRFHFRDKFIIFFVVFSSYALHPLNTEVIQWITCRKYLVGFIPIAFATLYISKWKLANRQSIHFSFIALLWILSLLAYPTAVFWIFWALYYLKRENLFKEYRFKLLLLGLVSILYLVIVGRNTGEVTSSLANIVPLYDKSLYFGMNALGRGYFNLLLPYWTFPYYKEGHIFTYIGLTFLFLTMILWAWVKSSSKLMNESERLKVHQQLKEALVWYVGGLIFVIPTMNTIFGFYDFMLADRHLYFSLPYFAIGSGYLIKAINLRFPLLFKRFLIPAGGLLLIYWSASIVAIYKKAPLWHDDFKLMENCALKENSYRCYSQAIRRQFFKSNCSRVKDLILDSSKLYSEKPPFALEFNSEIPFYHGTCIALNQTIYPSKKVELIESLDQTYRSSPELTFPVVLSLLELGNKERAFDIANSYYLSDLTLGPILATSTLQSIYAGHISALCSLDSTSLCQSRLNHFLSIHKFASLNSSAGIWGHEATILMAKRGGIVPNKNN
jgi:hypothetical protein